MINWILTDDRAGNNNQIYALVKALEIEVIEKKLIYNKMAKLPNFLNIGLCSINNKDDFINKPYPDLIIAAGRKAGRVALAIKKLHPACNIIQIMWPEYFIDKYDMILLPSHDVPKKYNNIYYHTGSIYFYDEQTFSKERQKFNHVFDSLPRPHISLLIGGNNKHFTLTDDDAREIANMANNMGSSILLTTSRRTPISAIEIFKKNITSPSYLYDFRSNDLNPYKAMLYDSDIIITTGDSVSMCSEACSTGKKTYIYANNIKQDSKYKRFIEMLYEGNYARPLSAINNDNFIPNKLVNCHQIADFINKNILLKIS
jgi:uncharacterized protein